MKTIFVLLITTLMLSSCSVSKRSCNTMPKNFDEAEIWIESQFSEFKISAENSYLLPLGDTVLLKIDSIVQKNGNYYMYCNEKDNSMTLKNN